MDDTDARMDQGIEHCGPAKSSGITQSEPEPTAAEISEVRTPLPKLQLFLVLLIQFSEPMGSVVIYPFVNQFVRDTGITHGDERKTGYYAGIIESAFYFAEAVTVFQWGWLSDRVGRRPILLLGPLGLALSMLSFGSSASFWRLVLSRGVQGIFNGSIGVSKTVIMEITDHTNIGDALAMMPLMWTSGVTIGPLMGGMLSNPVNRWPNVFGNIFLFIEHPFLLPCLAAAIISLSTFLIGTVGLKESHPSFRRVSRDSINNLNNAIGQDSEANASDSLLNHNDAPNYGTATSTESSAKTTTVLLKKPVDPAEEIVTLRSVLKSREMQLILVNYLFLAFAERCQYVLVPLIYSTSVEIGGLGLTPYYIGLIMSIWSFCNAIVQMNLVGKLIRKCGGARVYRFGYICYLACFLTFPFSTYFARQNGGVGVGSGVFMTVQLFFAFFSTMCYASTQVVIAETAPKKLIGSINGIVQLAGCAMRTFAPSFATSLFSFSIEKQVFGGYLVYAVVYAIVLCGIGFSRLLPDSKRKARSEHDIK